MTASHWEPTNQLGTSWVPNAIPHEVQVIFWICVIQMVFVGLSIVHSICRKTEYKELPTAQDPKDALALEGKTKAVEK